MRTIGVPLSRYDLVVGMRSMPGNPYDGPHLQDDCVDKDADDGPLND